MKKKYLFYVSSLVAVALAIIGCLGPSYLSFTSNGNNIPQSTGFRKLKFEGSQLSWSDYISYSCDEALWLTQFTNSTITSTTDTNTPTNSTSTITPDTETTTPSTPSTVNVQWKSICSASKALYDKVLISFIVVSSAASIFLLVTLLYLFNVSKNFYIALIGNVIFGLGMAAGMGIHITAGKDFFTSLKEAVASAHLENNEAASTLALTGDFTLATAFFFHAICAVQSLLHCFLLFLIHQSETTAPPLESTPEEQQQLLGQTEISNNPTTTAEPEQTYTAHHLVKKTDITVYLRNILSTPDNVTISEEDVATIESSIKEMKMSLRKTKNDEKLKFSYEAAKIACWRKYRLSLSLLIGCLLIVYRLIMLAMNGNSFLLDNVILSKSSGGYSSDKMDAISHSDLVDIVTNEIEILQTLCEAAVVILLAFAVFTWSKVPRSSKFLISAMGIQILSKAVLWLLVPTLFDFFIIGDHSCLGFTSLFLQSRLPVIQWYDDMTNENASLAGPVVKQLLTYDNFCRDTTSAYASYVLVKAALLEPNFLGGGEALYLASNTIMATIATNNTLKNQIYFQTGIQFGSSSLLQMKAKVGENGFSDQRSGMKGANEMPSFEKGRGLGDAHREALGSPMMHNAEFRAHYERISGLVERGVLDEKKFLGEFLERGKRIQALDLKEGFHTFKDRMNHSKTLEGFLKEQVNLERGRHFIDEIVASYVQDHPQKHFIPHTTSPPFATEGKNFLQVKADSTIEFLQIEEQRHREGKEKDAGAEDANQNDSSGSSSHDHPKGNHHEGCNCHNKTEETCGDEMKGKEEIQDERSRVEKEESGEGSKGENNTPPFSFLQSMASTMTGSQLFLSRLWKTIYSRTVIGKLSQAIASFSFGLSTYLAIGPITTGIISASVYVFRLVKIALPQSRTAGWGVTLMSVLSVLGSFAFYAFLGNGIFFDIRMIICLIAVSLLSLRFTPIITKNLTAPCLNTQEARKCVQNPIWLMLSVYGLAGIFAVWYLYDVPSAVSSVLGYMKIPQSTLTTLQTTALKKIFAIGGSAVMSFFFTKQIFLVGMFDFLFIIIYKIEKGEENDSELIVKERKKILQGYESLVDALSSEAKQINKEFRKKHEENIQNNIDNLMQKYQFESDDDDYPHK